MDMVKAVLDYEMPEGSKLKERMDEVMGGEVLELYTERVERLTLSKVVDRMIQGMNLSEEEACRLVGLRPEDYKRSQEEWKEKQQEKEENLPKR